ncbi:MAG: hypothetical protein K2Y09_00210 [Nitrosomonas sp.]|uniref:DUF6164 family protein n=1 Tax=Nitrosomonas sp. TaxID=42353 RepID=UPI001DE3628B|nr:DUF6164 family protein [Nitrosomonas sp.]MBX9893591.1 hypothetical protein [Nitrosomonas sp.]
MAKILFRLNGVPDDEANDVRELLTANAVDFYETSAGNWGVSIAAIWLEDENQFDRARALIDVYQHERTLRKRAEYERLKREGKHQTFLGAVSEKPVSFMVHLALAVMVLYLSAKLVLDLAA